MLQNIKIFKCAAYKEPGIINIKIALELNIVMKVKVKVVGIQPNFIGSP